MSTYGIPTLLKEYCPGTRAWMYEEVFTWLDTAPLPDGSQAPGYRMFALFADAGMGKSVFSAAMKIKLDVRINNDSSVVMVRAGNAGFCCLPNCCHAFCCYILSATATSHP